MVAPPTARVPMVAPDAGFVNMLRYGMLALRLLPESSCKSECKMKCIWVDWLVCSLDNFNSSASTAEIMWEQFLWFDLKKSGEMFAINRSQYWILQNMI